MDVIECRVRATDEALRRRADELAGQRTELAERARRLPAELGRARLLAGSELTAGIRRLREDARGRWSDPDYPDLLAVAVAELGRRHRHRTTQLLTAAAAATLAGLDTAAPRFTAPPDPGRCPAPVGAPPERARWPAEERAVPLAALPAGAALARLAWIGGPPAPLTAGFAVSGALVVVCWLVRTRRSIADRARLDRWTADVLADTRHGLDTDYARRELEVEPRVRAALIELSARLDRQVTAHDRTVRAVRVRRERARTVAG